MEISEIKFRLSIETVLQYYKLWIDNNRRICFPFQTGRTPSLYIYLQAILSIAFSPTVRKMAEVRMLLASLCSKKKYQARSDSESPNTARRSIEMGTAPLPSQRTIPIMFAHGSKH